MSYALYIHLPFCRRKCPYCNFMSITGADSLMEDYTNAVAHEIDRQTCGPFRENPRTVYIGGGTPSVVPFQNIKTIVQKFSTETIDEFTVEANPDSVEDLWLEKMLELGANRISIGIQSLDDTLLAHLGRLHTAKQAILSVVRSRRAGFTNISVDVMFSIPGQTIELWKKTLEEIIELQPDHVSGYCLSIENDTRYYEMMKHNRLSFPDQEETADMYNYINEMLENVGLKRYEISNFARPGWECKHNQVYWNFIPYLGVGASAHSYDCTIRRWNIADPVTYIRRSFSGDDTTSGYEKIDARKHTLETIMLSLRIIHGLDLQRLETLNPESKSAILEKISTLIDAGFLIKNDKGNIVLTTKGVLLADEIILEIVSDM